MKILFITLSNIGDCILTLPVLDALSQKYPQSRITCLVPERPAEIFSQNPGIEQVVVYDKHSSILNKVKLFFALSKEQFDIVIDLRNSFFGVLLPAKKRTSFFRFWPEKTKHMRDRHLSRAGLSQVPEVSYRSLVVSSEAQKYIDEIMVEHSLGKSNKLVAIAPGARSQLKCWDKRNFSQLTGRFLNEGWDVVLVGDKADQQICSEVWCNNTKAIDLSGRTSLAQLAALLKKVQLLVTNDSAVMHLASYINLPVVALFGPTNELKYGPWSQKSLIIKKDVYCRPCEKAACALGNHYCLASIRPDQVFEQIKYFLKPGNGKIPANDFKRILISRTDRIGDVLLSTPVIKAVRERFPQAFISVMVSPVAKDIVEGNPYLDEVIIFDKEFKHRSWVRSLKFASRLKKRKFDLAINLHPTKRTNILVFLAGIPQRLGYDRKMGFLLNRRKPHTKQEGAKHEARYNLDLIKDLGIDGNPADLFMPVKKESELFADELFKKEGISPADKLLAINPSASCPSKIWPVERFAQVAERLTRLYNFKVLVLAGPKDMALANRIILQHGVKGKVINLAGKTSLSQTASIIRRCTLFISNDSGPVHMASALGTPVISIFGRNQPGLSPERWGPLGIIDKYIHKQDEGCIECLAHNCKKQFACLKAISVDDVVEASDNILKFIHDYRLVSED